jgi:hypothetical protein
MSLGCPCSTGTSKACPWDVCDNSAKDTNLCPSFPGTCPADTSERDVRGTSLGRLGNILGIPLRQPGGHPLNVPGTSLKRPKSVSLGCVRDVYGCPWDPIAAARGTSLRRPGDVP